MYKALIIDDEEMARILLQSMILEYCEDIEIVDLCKDLPTGVKAIRKLKPDIVFLDIEMPGHSGLELLDFFDADEIDFSIIFVTAYNQYAIQAFKLSAIDYLLKPIEVEDLQTAVNLFKKNKQKDKQKDDQKTNEKYSVFKDNLKDTSSKKMVLNTLSSIHFVDIADILFFQGDGAYTKVFIKDMPTLTISRGLKSFESVLEDSPSFFRCHKSYLVNLKYATDYIKTNNGYLVVDKTHKIAVSSEKIAVLLQKMQE